jgi:ornithine carbamoyltransferase
MDNFLAITDHSPQELENLLDLAIRLKNQWKSGSYSALLRNKSLAMVFQKPSLRTRVSFEMAMQHLGGHALYLSPFEIGLGKRESIADIARVLSGYVDVIMARVFDHDHIQQLADWASVPVINGLSDYNHPCQGLADALTIVEEFGSLKGKNVAYVGDGNNVAVSLMNICSKMGATFRIANPEGYGMAKSAIKLARAFAEESGNDISLYDDPNEAVKDAHAIYTDTWTSMGQEEEMAQRAKLFPPYQVNAKLLAVARSEAIVLHCLPAHRGEEITDDVADGPQSRLFPQAENRLHAQKAILVRLLEERD